MNIYMINNEVQMLKINFISGKCIYGTKRSILNACHLFLQNLAEMLQQYRT